MALISLPCTRPQSLLHGLQRVRPERPLQMLYSRPSGQQLLAGAGAQYHSTGT